MKRTLACLILASILFIALTAPSTVAQGPAGAPEPQASPDALGKMAMATSNMAQTCQLMMQRDMAHEPIRMITGGVIAVIAVLALILFVVLEVQWIRLVSLRIRNESHQHSAT